MPTLFRTIGNICYKLQKKNSNVKFGLDLEEKLVPFIFNLEKAWFQFLYSLHESVFIKEDHLSILENINNEDFEIKRMEEFLLPSFGRFLNINFILYSSTKTLKADEIILLPGFSYNSKNSNFAEIIKNVNGNKIEYHFTGFKTIALEEIKKQIAHQCKNDISSIYNVIFNIDNPYKLFTSITHKSEHFNVLTNTIIKRSDDSSRIINERLRVSKEGNSAFMYIYEIAHQNRITDKEATIKYLERQNIKNNVSVLESVSVIESFISEPASDLFIMNEKTEEFSKKVLNQFVNENRQENSLNLLEEISSFLEANQIENLLDLKKDSEIDSYLKELHHQIVEKKIERTPQNLYPNVFDADFKQKLYSISPFSYNDQFYGKKQFNHRDIVYHEFYNEEGNHSYIKSIILEHYPNTKTYTIQHIENTESETIHNIYFNVIEKYLHLTAHLQQHQLFLKNYISPFTPYNSILLFHKPGSGKTISSVSIAESFKDYIHQQGKKIHIICPPRIRKEFMTTFFPKNLTVTSLKELKSMESPLKKNAKWLIQINYLLELLKQIGSKDVQFSNKDIEENHKDLFKILNEHILEFHPHEDTKIIGKYYNIYSTGGFNSFISNIYKNNSKKDFEKKIIKIFENSMLIIDEAHHYTSSVSDIHYNRTNRDDSDDKDKTWSNKLDIVIHILKLYNKQLKLVFLSGTPIVNKSKDLFDLLNLMIINDGTHHIEKIFHEKKYSPINSSTCQINNNILPNFIRSIQGRISYFNNNREMPTRLYPDDVYFNYPLKDKSFKIVDSFSGSNRLQLPVIYPSSSSDKLIDIYIKFLNNTNRTCYVICSNSIFKKIGNSLRGDVIYLDKSINTLNTHSEIHVYSTELENEKIINQLSSLVNTDTLILFYSENKATATNHQWQKKWLKDIFSRCNRYLPTPKNSIVVSNKFKNFGFIKNSNLFPAVICTPLNNDNVWELDKANKTLQKHNEHHPKIETMIEIIRHCDSKVIINTEQLKLYDENIQEQNFLEYLSNKIKKKLPGRKVVYVSGSVRLHQKQLLLLRNVKEMIF